MSKLFGKALSVGIFIVLGSAAMAQPAPTADATTRYKALLEQVRAEMFRAGPAVPGWDRGGADPDLELRSAGPERFYYLVEKKDGLREVIVMTDRPIAAVAPPDWRPVREYGSAKSPAEHTVIEFVPIDSWHVLAMRGGGRRLNDVDCMPGITHAILFERAGMPADADADRARFLVPIPSTRPKDRSSVRATKATESTAGRCATFSPTGER